jgi:hypothetical protein
MSPRQRQEPIEGFPPATRITFTGTAVNLDGFHPGLGQDVEVRIKGTVAMVGNEILKEETRPVVKIHADQVTVT